MGDSKRLSIILLIHNNIPMSLRCLESLSAAVTDVDHEVVLLDNGSSEDTGPLCEYGRAFRRFKRVHSGTNMSFSVGNNRGVRESSGRWLLFINNDVFLERESVKHLVAPLLEDQRIGAVGGKLLFPGETAVQHAGICQMLWEHPSNYGVGADPLDRRIQQKCKRFALSGAMLCLDREVFERVGGFDERYVWGTEDIDLCLKVRAAGCEVIYCPEAVAVHRESATLKHSKKRDMEGNCRLYRRLWDHVLVPAEQKYIRDLKDQGIRSVAVFGMGSAARSLAGILGDNDIRIAAFTSSNVSAAGEEFLGRPVLPLDLLPSAAYDRLMVATQYFFEVEPAVRKYDPQQEPIYPLLN